VWCAGEDDEVRNTIAIVVGNLSTEVGGVGAESDRRSWVALGNLGCRSEQTVTRREMVEWIAAQAMRARRKKEERVE